MQNTLTISKRGASIPASPVREFAPLATLAKKRGITIYHLNIGDPDFPLPDLIKQTMVEKAQTLSRLPYPAFRGQEDLLTAWKKYFQDIEIPLQLDDEDMLITAGASDAMTLLTSVITDPGDEILVFEPFYGPYRTYGSYLSVTLVAVPLDTKNGYHLPAKEEIVKKITSRTKAIYFINPNNPSGTVFTKEELETILEVAREYNLFVVSDETYRGLVFDGKESLSMLHVATEEDTKRIIIADSLSKRLNVCGARMGIIVSKNRDVINAAYKTALGRPFATYFEQEIVAPLLADSLEYIKWLSNEYQKRRDTFISALESHLNLRINKPEGAFYAMVQLPIDDAVTFVKWLLTDFHDNNETVMLSPGSGFYETPGMGKNEVRVAFVLNEKELVRAAEILAKAVKAYNEK